ncbi:hypothetical protein C1931_10625 [Stenotrophomonas sp. YAU14A_MKIMI4_1]|nr:hypothetical protein C1931_10625 [Stenotrophomonas sp. YAU14A_MKIMI4_1]
MQAANSNEVSAEQAKRLPWANKATLKTRIAAPLTTAAHRSTHLGHPCSSPSSLMCWLSVL